MSKTFNLDLPMHASDKVKRALEDVLQLTDDPGERFRIGLMATGHLLGNTAGTFHAMLFSEGVELRKAQVEDMLLDLLGKVMREGAEAAWELLGGMKR